MRLTCFAAILGSDSVWVVGRCRSSRRRRQLDRSSALIKTSGANDCDTCRERQSMGLISIAFPAIDPVALRLGPLAVRWYGLAYMAGLLIGWQYVKQLVG